MQPKSLLLGAFAAGALAADWTVMVGGKGGKAVYEPSTVNAEIGDTVTFMFHQKQHDVTQGVFDQPCQPLAGGFYSTIQTLPDVDNTWIEPTAFVVTIADKNPKWFYCSQHDHCQNGLVGVINPPADQTLDAFKNAAVGVENAVSPPNVVAGGSPDKVDWKKHTVSSPGGLSPASTSSPANTSSSSTSSCSSSISATCLSTTASSSSSMALTSVSGSPPTIVSSSFNMSSVYSNSTLTSTSTSTSIVTPTGPSTSPAIAHFTDTGGASAMGGSAIGLVALMAGAIVLG